MDRQNETGGQAPDIAGEASSAELDPRATLSRLRAVVYDWDMTSDRLVWGANASETLADFSPDALANGAGYAELVSADSPSSRFQAIQELSAQDDGEGAPYRALYRLTLPGGGS